jgi:hypothetical protein
LRLQVEHRTAPVANRFQGIIQVVASD